MNAMKTGRHLEILGCMVLCCLAVLPVDAQTSPTSPPSGTTDQSLPPPTPYQVVNQGANNNVWERTTYEKSPSGRIVPKKHRYTELATGLNYLKNGQWTESKEEIDIRPDGTAQAIQGQHRAYFPGDIYQGQIELVTPDGVQLHSRPMGISYFDGQNSVLIAELKDSVGVVTDTNQVIYPDAFTDFKADLRYTYTKAGFEQDIILREQPPTPESFGLNSQNTRLQVLTEFFDTADPAQTTSTVNSQSGLSDPMLTFGAMQMVRGKAFSIGDSTKKTPTYKSWQHLEGRTFLVEELPVQRIETQLEQLPMPASANTMVSSASSVRHKVSATRLLTPSRLVQKTGTNTVQLAKVDLNRKQGVVLDYTTINSSTNDYTFQGDTTYLVNGSFNVVDTATIEGGTVIKFTGSANGLFLYGTINCQTPPYRPAVFTSSDDNSVGEIISGSSGNPTTGSGTYLWLNSFSLNNLRFCYAYNGIFSDGPDFDLWNCQFINCSQGIQPDDYTFGTIVLHNVLFDDCDYAVNGSSGGEMQVTGEQITSDATNFMVVGDGSASLFLTNSIIVGTIAVSGGFYTNQVVINPAGTIFQTVGAGCYYLTNGSPYRNIGTTNIDPALLADLATKTTYPPIVYSNTTISVATTFSPQAQRDTNATPDLGYHYDPLDYVFGGVNASSNLTFTAGTAVGWFELPGSGGPGYGIGLFNDITNTFIGTVTSPCTFVRYTAVQEGGNGLWTDKGWLGGIVNVDSYDQNNPANLLARFTRFGQFANEPGFFRDGQSGQPLVIQATDCELWGTFGGYNIMGAFTNCLWNRSDFSQSTSCTYPYEILRNCTLHGGTFDIGHSESSAPYWYTSVRDCAFDGVSISIDDPFGVNTNYADYDYNAFLTNADQLAPEGTHNVVVTNFNWQSSWFGDYYQPTNSLLIDAGDRTADQVGLYHFTTQTNQTIEADSIVDIGYHYVATDQYGNPLDSNGDGIPDYLEDANGNGITDPGEVPFAITIENPVNGSVIH